MLANPHRSLYVLVLAETHVPLKACVSALWGEQLCTRLGWYVDVAFMTGTRDELPGYVSGSELMNETRKYVMQQINEPEALPPASGSLMQPHQCSIQLPALPFLFLDILTLSASSFQRLRLSILA